MLHFGALSGYNRNELIRYTAQLMQALGNKALLSSETLKNIKCPVVIMRGELDKMVSRDESEATARHLPHAVYLS